MHLNGRILLCDQDVQVKILHRYQNIRNQFSPMTSKAGILEEGVGKEL